MADKTCVSAQQDRTERALAIDLQCNAPTPIQIVPETARISQYEIARAFDNDEFEFDVQPIVSLTTDTAVGYEVLARWASPTRGRVLPEDFLPDVHLTGCSHQFDTTMIEKATSALALWRAEPTSPQAVWVNVSPRQLDPMFPYCLADAMDRHGLGAGEVVVELTEDTTASTPDRIEVLDSMRDLGIRIAIDDFGTGHAQLSYLHDLQVDFVKLDRSMVGRLDQDSRTARIAESVIELVQGLGAQVVAEGVERPEELALLRELGCDFAQGFLVARPARFEDVCGA